MTKLPFIALTIFVVVGSTIAFNCGGRGCGNNNNNEKYQGKKKVCEQCLVKIDAKEVNATVFDGPRSQERKGSFTIEVHIQDLFVCIKFFTEDDKCNGLKIKDLVLLDCASIVRVEIEYSELCLLDLVTIIIETSKIDVSRKYIEPNAFSTLLETLLKNDCDDDKKKKHCQRNRNHFACQNNKPSPPAGPPGPAGPLAGLLG